MLNLSTLLEDSARRHPDRDAVVLGDVRVDYQTLNALANKVANLLVSRGIKPGDKVALSCPNLPQFPVVYNAILKTGAVVVPMNVLLKGREVAYHLQDSDAKAYICFEGSPELPMGAEGWAGFNDAASCETFFLITATPGAASPHRGRRDPPLGRGRAPDDVRDRRHRGDRHGRHPLHERHDRPPEGCGALARQPAAERAHVQPAVRRRRARRAPDHAAPLPLVRLHGADERRLLGGRDPRAASPVRRGQGRGDPPDGERHVLRGRAHDVLGPARRADRRRRRRPHRGEPARRGLRWGLACPSRSSRSSRTASRCRSSRATASPRPLRWRPSRTPAAPPGRARSVCRSGEWSASSSTRTGTSSRARTASVRSPSAATTS